MTDAIKIKLTRDQLNAINTLWSHIPFMDTSTKEMRVLVSISNHLANKLVKRQLTLQFSNKAKTTISLDYHKAYFLEQIIQTILPSVPTTFMGLEYEKQQLQQLAAELNQKLA